MIPFTPGASVQLDATTTTARVEFPATRGSQVRIASPSASAATFVVFGDDSVEATTSGLLILPGTAEIFTVPPDATHIAGITIQNLASLFITFGDGA